MAFSKFLAHFFCLFFFVFFNLAQGMEMVTYNIRNFDKGDQGGQSTNKDLLKSTLRSLNADLFAIEEVVNLPAFTEMINTNFPEYAFVLTSCGGTGNQKLGFLYKKATVKLNSFKEDARLSAGGQCNRGVRPGAVGYFTYLPTKMNFAAVAVHLKAGGAQANADVRYRQYGIIGQILTEIRQKGESKIVVLGDFNTTEFILRDQNYARFIEFIDNNQLIDFGAEINCSAYWWGETDDNKEDPSVLDHIIITQEFNSAFRGHTVAARAHCEKVQCRVASATDLGLTYQQVSDHCPIQASFKE